MKRNYYVSEELVYLEGKKGMLAFSPTIPAWVWVDENSKKALDTIKKGHSIEEIAQIFSIENDIPCEIIIESLKDFLDNCPVVTEEIVEEINNKSKVFSKLDQVWLCPSGWCNLSCCYCAVSPPITKQNQKSLDFWIDVVVQCINLGAKEFVFSGGEPTLYENCIDLILWINDNTSSEILITTNGTLLSEDDIDSLSKTRAQIQISLDGTTPETHDTIRGKGSFIKILEVIKKFIDNGKIPDISMTVCKANIYDIDKMPEFVTDLGIRELRIAPYFETGRAATDISNSLSFEERVELTLKILKIIRKNAANITCGIGVFSNPRIGDSNDLCGAGNGLIAINHDGGVYACVDSFQISGFCAGFIENEPLSQIMNSNLLMNIRSDSLYNLENCRTCVFRKICGGGCPMERAYLGSIGLTYDKECNLIKTVLKKIILEEENYEES